MTTLTGSTMSEMIGQNLGPFRIDAMLGEGNMGSVYQAYDSMLARKVVLKVMHRQLANHDSFQKRFMQEAQAAARLDHPSIVNIYNFDIEPSLYMVMEYITGPSLGEYVKHQQAKNEVVNLDTVLRLVAQVADALDYAHGQGVVHRDIKPSNILLKPLTRPDREGDPTLRAVVTDFGLAKLLEGGMHTLTGTFMGTLSYMSPEQCLGRDLDGRSDIYSLGIVLYQLATGQLPFNVKSPTDAIRMHVKELPPAPRLVRPGLPELVERVILQTIAKNPASRFQTGSQLAEALRRAAWSLVTPGATETLLPGTRIGGGSSIFVGTKHDPAGPMIDQLLIYHAGEAPRVMGMNDDEITVGRGTENVVMLPDKGVSRHHVTIRRGDNTWIVVDQESTNGAFLDKIRLAPSAAEEWSPNTELRVGPYSLQWQKAAPIPLNGGGSIITTAAQLEDNERPQKTNPGEIEIVVDPSSSSAAPGERANIQVMLMNRGPIVEHVNVRIDNLPDEWSSYSEQLVKLTPGSRGFCRVSIAPPRDASARSGLHRFEVVATPMSNPDAFVSASCELNVGSFQAFKGTIEPRRMNKTGNLNLSLVNNGNGTNNYVVSADKNHASLKFDPDKAEVRLNPGQDYAVPIKVAPRKRKLMGSARLVSYEVEIWSQNAKLDSYDAEFEIRPIIPSWLLFSLITILVAVGSFIAIWLNFYQ